MKQIEDNVIESFRLVKNDIIKMQNNLTILSQNQERLMQWITDTRDKEAQLYQRMKDLKLTSKVIKTKTVVTKRARKKYVASKRGKSVHESNCPFAKNIKPKSKIVFSSKNKALNAGYKSCDCIKKI